MVNNFYVKKKCLLCALIQIAYKQNVKIIIKGICQKMFLRK